MAKNIRNSNERVPIDVDNDEDTVELAMGVKEPAKMLEKFGPDVVKAEDNISHTIQNIWNNPQLTNNQAAWLIWRYGCYCERQDTIEKLIGKDNTHSVA